MHGISGLPKRYSASWRANRQKGLRPGDSQYWHINRKRSLRKHAHIRAVSIAREHKKGAFCRKKMMVWLAGGVRSFRRRHQQASHKVCTVARQSPAESAMERIFERYAENRRRGPCTRYAGLVAEPGAIPPASPRA